MGRGKNSLTLPSDFFPNRSAVLEWLFVRRRPIFPKDRFSFGGLSFQVFKMLLIKIF